MTTFAQLLAVGVGGLLGSIARFITVRLIDQRMESAFPFGTLAVNFLGSFLLGFLAALISKKGGLDPYWGLFFGTGVCGGFTTFSAFSVENLHLLQQRPLMSALYIVFSLCLGIGAAALGYFAGKSA